MDYIRALGDAYEAEQGPAAKDAIAQILTNSRMCAEGHRPLCQDTGIVNVFVKWGRIAASTNRRSRCRRWSMRACAAPTTIRRTSCAPRCWPIRPSPAATRRDNTPCVLHVEMVPGHTVSIDVAAKGGGSENKSKFKMMNPATISSTGCSRCCRRWAPAGARRACSGIGIGGTAEHCVQARQAER